MNARLQGGTRLGPYEVLAPLGAGGMGEVWRAKDSRLGREVAIKVLPAEVASDPDRLRRFEQEARAASALSHPNILTVFDVGRHEETSFLVTELLDGESLRARLAEGPLPLRKAIEIGVAVARGLAAAHAKGIVHRDLKPENLFLTRDGGVKILDFGLAKLTLPESGGVAEATTVAGMTATGMVMGTAGYMAPEQVRGEPVDARGDLFSLGCVLYELVSGRRAFAGNTAPETLSAILRDDPAPLAAPGPTGSVVEGIVRRCLEKRPDDRFQAARDLGFAFEALLGTGSGTDAPLVPPTHSRPTSRAAAAAAGVALGFALGGASLWLLAPRSRPAPIVPTFQRITFQRGNVLHARFTPDAESVVFSASWEGRPTEIFSTRIDGHESRPLDLPKADLFGVSKQGDLLLLRKSSDLSRTTGIGTLARASLSGGAPRDLAESIHGADWLADGAVVALHHLGPGHDALELPLGTRILENTYTPPRVSPDGSRIAIFQNTEPDITLAILDGKGKPLWSLPTQPGDLAWHPNGEIWLSRRAGGPVGLFAARQGEPLRPVLLGPGWTLHDIAADGRLLLEREIERLSLRFRATGDAQERELSWLDGSEPHGLSSDGSILLFSELQEGGDRKGGVYVRHSDGSPAVRIADGEALALSDDGSWALVRDAGSPPRYWLTPSGAGEPREISLAGERLLEAIALPGREPSFLVSIGPTMSAAHIEIVEPSGRTKLALPGAFFADGVAVSPDGRSLAYSPSKDHVALCQLASAQCRDLPIKDEEPIQWSSDGRFLFLRDFGRSAVHVTRYDLATGARQPWLELGSNENSSFVGVGRVLLTRDGKTYAYGDAEIRDSSLFIVEGLK